MPTTGPGFRSRRRAEVADDRPADEPVAVGVGVRAARPSRPRPGHDHGGRPRGARPERRAADQGGPGARHLHPALLLARPHEAGRHVSHVPRRGRRAAWAPDRVRDPGVRRHGRAHPEGQRAQGAGRRPRVPAHQPSARLPGLRPRRRVPTAGPDAGVRAGRVALHRGEASLREADPDQRPRAPRPRTLHPVRALHALRRRDRRRSADRLRRSRRPHRGDHVSRRPVHVVLLGEHRADLPGGGAHGEAVPLRRPAVGPHDLRDFMRHVRGAVPRRGPVVVQPPAPSARRRFRPREPGLAV